MSNSILHKKIRDSFNLFNPEPDIPDYIKDNLKHNFRPYQEEALKHFIFSQDSSTSNISFNHLLFHMATGSGKTLVMAAIILYMYQEKNICNFLFFVNSDAIIEKTIQNLLDDSSSKYLFSKSGININGKRVAIKLVESYPNFPSPNVIYLKVTTIQKLHSDLTDPKENSLTYNSLSFMNLVLLADEAHHINAWTRKDKRKLSAKEAEERTWENTVSSILSSNVNNRLFEFTATIDLNNDNLFEKYREKIVYQYDLKKFMNEGYSKNVTLLRANEEDKEKMLNAVLLSQYRKYIANDNNIFIKPVILFKSNSINVSMNANETFTDIISSMSVESLSNVIRKGQENNHGQDNIWSKMFEYYSHLELSKVVQDLKFDFKPENVINANSQSFLTTENTILLNTLEDFNNPIRIIFAVAKLNEGWDVLNLFDIVRISEGATSTRTSTNSEAQLIGRGARYYPFIQSEEVSFTRRYDSTVNDLKIIETLHYHTINQNAYIKNLENSLDAANIQTKDDQFIRFNAKIKPSFKKTKLYKNGKVYINKVVETLPSDYSSLKSYGAESSYFVPYSFSVEQTIGKKSNKINLHNLQESYWNVPDKYLLKAFNRNQFYNFSSLRKYVPLLESVNEFISDENYLGNLIFYIEHPKGSSIESISPIDKMKMVDSYLAELEVKLRRNYLKSRGTPIFEGVPLSSLISDYEIEMNKVSSNVNVDEIIQQTNMKNHDWFVYDYQIGNRLEESMVMFVSRYIEKLKSEYSDVYLIRNERRIKVVEIDGVRGFMPDFLLYMKDSTTTIQVFLEPKGKHLLEKDKWKEDFLLSLSTRDDIFVIDENDDVRLLGIKFYSDYDESIREFREDFTNKLL